MFRRIMPGVLGLMVAASPLALAAEESGQVVHFTIDTSKDVHPISPYIYGMNAHGPHARPLSRLGGNRWSAYNWENNASNAGSDWHHQSDGYLCASDTPGEAVRPFIEAAAKNHQAIIVTVPMCGYVSADKKADGDVNQTPDYLAVRFHPSLPRKNAPFSLKPDVADGAVYEDEFVNWVEKAARVDPGQQIFYALDNEPDLWSSTHARIHPEKTTYRELINKTIGMASAIKDVKSDALVFGFVSYGWNGFRTLQDAPDAGGRDFTEQFLTAMKHAETRAHRRLVDVLDLHWYPEARAGNVRITGKDATPEVVAARLQAPRSLWDPTYSEKSWITEFSTHGPIQLLPRIKAMIDRNYPGTKLALTEYTYGGGSHISGGIAEADALGIFGQQGLFAAAWWDTNTGTDYINAALDAYLNFDGAGGHFGDTSVAASTDDVASSSVYASVYKSAPGRVVAVLLNKTDHPLDADLAIAGGAAATSATCYRIDGSAAAVKPAGQVKADAAGHLRMSLPAYSVTTTVIGGE